MKSSLLSFIPSASFLIIAFLGFLGVPPCVGGEAPFADCSNQFVCGELTATFPFWGNQRPRSCGVPALELACENGNTTIEINGVKYLVLGIHESTHVLEIAREDYLNGICPPGGANSTFDPVLFDVVTGYEDVTLIYGCVSAVVTAPTAFTCAINGVNYQTGFVQKGANGPGVCYSSVNVPVNGSALELTIASTIVLQEKLKEGFQVSWKFDSKACSECTGRVGGACGYDRSSNKTTCYCPNQSDRSSTCSSSPVAAPTDPARSDGKPSSKVPIGVGIGIAGAVVVGAFLGIWFFVIIRRRKRTFLRMQSGDTSTPPSSKGLAAPQPKLSQSTPSYPSAKSDLGKGSTYFGVQMFEYSELEEATDGFNPSRELGDGGFGIVYYGVLKDGRAVAVKRLYDNNGRRAEQFMNEVEILARLRHKNLVTLFGCTSRRSQELLLVYEYIPNGTVADHLHGRRSNSVLLPWPVRLSIAIETADALAYLHGVDVIHRDVKTNNILLDNNFSVKVADFGLSRLFPTNATHVSTAPQGTPGYVDPEYFECYQLTDKSDVYSFGVVLIELISSLQAVDTTRHRLDINLGSMAINKIQNHALNELVDPSLGFEKDHAVRSMVISVAELAFRCLQQERDMRPTMAEALAALRRIQNENYGAEKVLVVDVREDDVGLLKHTPLPLVLSPDTLTEKWASDSTLPTTDSSSA